MMFLTLLDRRFLEFHSHNPHVYEELVRLVREAKDHGHRRVGIKMVWEVVRWNLTIRTNVADEEDFKLNNNYHSRYARLIMVQEPDLHGVFELRQLKS